MTDIDKIQDAAEWAYRALFQAMDEIEGSNVTFSAAKDLADAKEYLCKILDLVGSVEHKSE